MFCCDEDSKRGQLPSGSLQDGWRSATWCTSPMSVVFHASEPQPGFKRLHTFMTISRATCASMSHSICLGQGRGTLRTTTVELAVYASMSARGDAEV